MGVNVKHIDSVQQYSLSHLYKWQDVVPQGCYWVSNVAHMSHPSLILVQTVKPNKCMLMPNTIDVCL